MTKLCFLDTETTGLDPRRHEVWEIGLIIREGISDKEYLWRLPVDLAQADLIALNIGGYQKRRYAAFPQPRTVAESIALIDLQTGDHGSQGRWRDLTDATMPEWVKEFSSLVWGAHIVGAVPSFDAMMLTPLLHKWGSLPTWHYHIVDIEAMAAGALGIEPPWNSKELSTLIGVDPEQYEIHTALGDARWARDVYDATIAYKSNKDTRKSSVTDQGA